MASRDDYESSFRSMLKHKDILYPNAKNVKRRFNLAKNIFCF